MAATETTATGPTVKRHPIRGLIWGFVLGIGIAIYLVIFSVIAFGTLTPYLVILLTTIAGGAWGWFAPPKKPKGDKGDGPDGGAAPEGPPAAPPTVTSEAPSGDAGDDGPSGPQKA